MLINTLFNALLMSYGLLPTSSLWQLKLCRKFDSKLPSTGRLICHLRRDPGSFPHWGNVDPVNLPKRKKKTKRNKTCQTTRPLHNSARFPVANAALKRRYLPGAPRSLYCKCGCRRAACGPGGALPTSSLSKWHRRSATSQLPHGG